VLQAISETKAFDFPDNVEAEASEESGNAVTPTEESLEFAQEAEEASTTPIATEPPNLPPSAPSSVSIASIESDSTDVENQHRSVSRTSSNTSDGASENHLAGILHQTEWEVGRKKKRKSTMWSRLIGKHDNDLLSPDTERHGDGAFGPLPSPDKGDQPKPDHHHHQSKVDPHHAKASESETEDDPDGLSRSQRFVRKVSKKIRGKKDETEGPPARRKAPRFEIIDFSSEEFLEKAPVRKYTYVMHLESLGIGMSCY
jgi:hypothetical protein